MKKYSVTIAKSAGFCFGVRRAITLAEKTVEVKKKIYTLGPLIHNPQEVQRLTRKGIRPVLTPRNLAKGDTLIIRTHGIPQTLFEQLKKRKLALVDATCPFVKRAQDIVKQLRQKDYQVIIVGEKTHPEVVALVSYGGKKCRVAEKKEDAGRIRLAEKVGVVSQTTQTPANFEKVIRYLNRVHPEVEVYNTICRATIDRQTEARRLARRVDVMIVVGGKNSGNTRRLDEICRHYAPTYLIETAKEVRPAWFKGVRSVGLTAGASTPDWIIQNVKGTIEDILQYKKEIREPEQG